MERKIKPLACSTHLLDAQDFASDPRRWLQRQEAVGKEAWFLAHADDGLIWGRLHDGALVTSHDYFPEVSPPLRAITLQEAHLFGERAEVRVWRNSSGFSACRLEDRSDGETGAFDEVHLLWGTRAEKGAGGFTLVSDGRQGLRHAVPLELPCGPLEARGTRRPLRLLVRHYLAYDEDGQAYVFLSRLVAIRVEGGQK